MPSKKCIEKVYSFLSQKNNQNIKFLPVSLNYISWLRPWDLSLKGSLELSIFLFIVWSWFSRDISYSMSYYNKLHYLSASLLIALKVGNGNEAPYFNVKDRNWNYRHYIYMDDRIIFIFITINVFLGNRTFLIFISNKSI